jgi:hypothetical protein
MKKTISCMSTGFEDGRGGAEGIGVRIDRERNGFGITAAQGDDDRNAARARRFEDSAVAPAQPFVR